MANILVDRYANNGFLPPTSTITVWQTSNPKCGMHIFGYAEHEHDEDYFFCFEHMQFHGISLDAIGKFLFEKVTLAFEGKAHL